MSYLSAIAIPEKRIGKRGESVYSGRAHVVLERSWIQFKSSAWLVVRIVTGKQIGRAHV